MLSALGANGAFCDEQYLVNGKHVERNVYDAARLVNEAGILMADNNIDRAIGKLKKALSYDTNFAPAQTNLGILLARQGKNKEALEHLIKSVEIEDSPASSYLNLASFYQTEGDLDGAIKTYKIFLEKVSSDPSLTEQSKATLEMLEKERDRRKGTGIAPTNESKNYFADAPVNRISHWTDWHMPIKVYIAPTGEIEGYDSHFDRILKQSFYDWEKASENKIKFRFVENKDDSDIDCYWTNDPDELGNGIENGHTNSSTRFGSMNHAEIALRAKETEGSFPFTDNTIITTCRHEIGHALGIMWHSTDPADLMYFSIPLADNEKTISPSDKNTLTVLYTQQIPLSGLLLDFCSYKENLKKFAPLTLVLAILLGLALLLRKKPQNKNRKNKNVRTK